MKGKNRKRALSSKSGLAMVALVAGLVPLGSAVAADASASASSGSPGCSANKLSAGDSKRTINVNGQARSFVLHVPRNYSGAMAVPLIVDYHGHGGDGAGEKGWSGLANLSETAGFIVAYPDGLGGNWNYHESGGVDDLGFSRAIIKDLGEQGCIDKNRVYAAGYSQGGGMSYGVACYAADVFAAVVASSFDLYDGQRCSPARPVSVLSFRGTADPLAIYTGSPGFGDGPFVGAKETLRRFGAIEHCKGSPRINANGCEIYTDCDGGSQIGLCTIQGGGHLTGDAKKSWDFLRQFSLSGSGSNDANAGGGNSGDQSGVAAAQSGHIYKLRNANSGKVLGVLGMSKDNGGKALQWSDNGTRDHEWRLDLLPNGYYKLTNMNSNKVLAVLNMSTSDGGEVIQWDDNGTADHEWKFIASTGGTYKLVNRNSGKVLGVRNMSRDDGGVALQWSDNGTRDHDWTLEEVTNNGGTNNGGTNNGGTNNGGTNNGNADNGNTNNGGSNAGGNTDNGGPTAVAVKLAAVGGNGKVDLSWTVTGNITTVQVYRDTDPNPQGRQRMAILPGKARSYTDTTVVNGTPYWYWIKYTLANGVIDNSGAGTATPGGNDQVIAVTGVSVTSSATVKVGATTNLTASVQPSNASNKAVTWSTSNAAVATVSSSGVVTGIAKGNATITVTTADGNRTASSAITVSEDQPMTIPVTGVSVTPSATVKVGATASLTASVQPSNASNKAVTWSTSNAAVATVSSSGVVTGIAKGNATITVTTADGNRTASSAITVNEDQPTPTAPSAPSGLSARVVDNGAVTLAWTDNSSNETGFRVERRATGDANWSVLASLGANSRTYSDAKVPMGKAYEYRVSAYNAGGSSAAATAAATLMTLVQYGEQKYKETTTMKCAACHGADGNGIWPLAARTTADFAALVQVIADTMPNENRLCVDNCAKGTAAYIIKMQTGVSLDENGNSGGTQPVAKACKGGELFCEDFESFTGSTATSSAWSIENDNPGRATVSIDGIHARGTKALHLSTTDNGMAFLVPAKFSPPGNSFFGRMWIWVDAFPTKPDYAHFTMVEASGANSGTKVRPIGGQYIPGQGNGSALWGVGSDGGPTGDWVSWQTTTPTAGGKWTCMEWQMDAADNSVNVWIDGVAKPELSVSTKKHGNGGSDFIFPNFNKIRLGWQLYQGGTTPPKFNIWLDDLSLSTTRVGCGSDAGTDPSQGNTTTSWRGVSLSSAEFGEHRLPGTYNTDYAYPTANEAAYFAGKGMNMVRLPFRWERLQRGLYQAFDATELARLKGFVDAATAAGVTVLIDPHNYARYGLSPSGNNRDNLIGSAAVPIAAFADFWSRLASEFKGNAKVMFGLMNEPYDIKTETWADAANAAIAAIRATGATNTITVPGVAWTGAWSWSDNYYGTPNAVAMQKVTDSGNNMLFEVHQYLDQDKSGTSATCVSPTIGSERLAGFTAWLKTNHRRALLGEIGAGSNSVCNQAVADALNHLQANADVWTGWVWWAAGPWWFDASTGADYFMSIEPRWQGNNWTNGTAVAEKEQMQLLAPYLRR